MNTKLSWSQFIKTFERIYNIIKRVVFYSTVGLCLILSLSFGIGIGYFVSLISTSQPVSDQELKTHILNIPDHHKLDLKHRTLIEAYNEADSTVIAGPENVSPYVPKALTASEDSDFCRHNGILPKAILRAMYQDIFNLQYGTGGSTITQQLVKNQLLTNEQTYNRKAQEITLALRTEKLFSKDEIMFTYLNIVPFGRDTNGAHITGISAAAYGIFGKSSQYINLAESAYLVGLLQSPYFYTPYLEDGSYKPKSAIKMGIYRQHYVLKRMRVEKLITKAEYEAAMAYDIESAIR